MPNPTTSSIICKCCFQPGHFYRDCDHPCLDELHDKAKKIWIAASTNPRTGRHTHIHSQTGIDYAAIWTFIGAIPIPVLRALLWKFKHPKARATETYPDIRSWRVREQQHGIEVRNTLPSRIGVYSAANRGDLNDMMVINYKLYCDDEFSSSLRLRTTRNVLTNAHSTARMLNRVRRDLIDPEHVFTRRGLVDYTNQIISWLEAVNTHTANNIPVSESDNLGEYVPELPPTHLRLPDNELEPYRNVPQIKYMVAHILPQEPSPDVSQLNTPPPFTPRRPVFNIDIVRNNPEQMSTLSHSVCCICWDEVTPENGCATDCNHTYCHSCMNKSLQTVRRKTQQHSPRPRYMNLKCAMCRKHVSDINFFGDSDHIETQVLETRMKLYVPIE